MRDNLPKELDFKLEVENLKLTKSQLKNIRKLKIPYVVEQLCNDTIITMEYIDGISLLNINKD